MDDVHGDHPVDVLVTVDHDAESAFLQYATERDRGPSYLSEGVFGTRAVGLGRLLESLGTRGVPATFFVPGWVAERRPDDVAAISAAGHEIGLHGYLHENPLSLSGEEEERRILHRGLDALRSATDSSIVGYRPPGSRYSEATVALLREAGFRYGSAMQDDDGAYLHPGAPSLVEIPCHWLLCDDLFGWHADVRMTPSQVAETWTTELEAIGRYPGRTYVLTLHPHQIGHPGRLAMLEGVLDRAIELGARFRTCGDLADEVLARSAD